MDNIELAILRDKYIEARLGHRGLHGITHRLGYKGEEKSLRGTFLQYKVVGTSETRIPQLPRKIKFGARIR